MIFFSEGVAWVLVVTVFISFWHPPMCRNCGGPCRTQPGEGWTLCATRLGDCSSFINSRIAGRLGYFKCFFMTNRAALVSLLVPPYRYTWRVLLQKCQGHCFPKVSFLSHVSSLKQTSTILALFESLVFKFVWSWLGGSRDSQPRPWCASMAEVFPTGWGMHYGDVGVKMNRYLWFFSVLEACKRHEVNVPDGFLRK